MRYFMVSDGNKFHKPGPKPERVKIEDDWENAVKKALEKKRPDDRDVEDVQQMRKCPACDGRGEPRKETPREYPKSPQLFIEGHRRRHAESQ